MCSTIVLLQLPLSRVVSRDRGRYHVSREISRMACLYVLTNIFNKSNKITPPVSHALPATFMCEQIVKKYSNISKQVYSLSNSAVVHRLSYNYGFTNLKLNTNYSYFIETENCKDRSKASEGGTFKTLKIGES